MSLENKREITDRIWQHSQAANMGKLVLLALVEYADDDGFCYPSHETIGRMIGLKGKPGTIQRNALHHLTPLAKSKEVISWKQQGKRGGRGYTNIYLITVGLSDEEIKERVKRRFKLFGDEVESAISQTGEGYQRLCADRKIAVDILDLTNPEPKKGVKIDDNKEEKPPKIDVLNSDKVVKNDPQLPEDDKKGVKIGGGTKDSLDPLESLKDNLDSSPNGEGDKSPPLENAPIPESGQELEQPQGEPQNPAQKRNRGKKPQGGTSDIPAAIKVYQVIARRLPDKAIWPDIENKVGSAPECLERWGKVITAYIGCGWNKLNLSGMLRFYEENRIPSTEPVKNGVTKNGHYGKPTKQPTSRPDLADPDRFAAELAAQANPKPPGG